MAIQSEQIQTAQELRALFDKYWLDLGIGPDEVIKEGVLEAKLGLSNTLRQGEQARALDVQQALDDTVVGFATNIPGGDGSDGNLTVSGTTYLNTNQVYQFNNLHVTSNGRILPQGSGESLRILVKNELRIDDGGSIAFDGSSGRRGSSGRYGWGGRWGSPGTGRSSGGEGGRGGRGGDGGRGQSSYWWGWGRRTKPTNGGDGGRAGRGGTGGRGGNGQYGYTWWWFRDWNWSRGPYAGRPGSNGYSGSNGDAGSPRVYYKYSSAVYYNDVVSQKSIEGRLYGGGAGGRGEDGDTGEKGHRGGERRSLGCRVRGIYGICWLFGYRHGIRGRGGTGGRGGRGGGEGGGGGYGAGIIYIEAKHVILNGVIQARGGTGGSGGWGGNSGQQGQGGAGGLVVLKHHTLTGNGHTDARGGSGYASGPNGHDIQWRRH